MIKTAQVIASFLLLNAALLFPLQYDFGREWQTLGVSGDVVLLTAFVALIALKAGVASRAAWAATFAASGVWTTLIAFEIGRRLGYATMGQDPIMYDALLLSKHLFILARDLYGNLAHLGVVGIVVFVVVLFGVGVAVFRFLQKWFVSEPKKQGAVVLGTMFAVAVIGSLVGTKYWPGRFVVPEFAANMGRSWDLYRQVKGGVNSSVYEQMDEIELTMKPDVRIYAVESYGMVLRSMKEYRKPWTKAGKQNEARLREAGWFVATGRSEAPVNGGRSWIADASLLLGMRVSHHSAYQHLMELTDEMPHLPKFFEKHGYETVLVRPKDRARPGVSLINHFRFKHTIFHDDLNYKGPVVGWGEIPDDYTIGFVQDTVLAPLKERPTFTFMHLATAHLPWKKAPDRPKHWTEWEDRPGRRLALFKTRSTWEELRMHFQRYRREGRDGKGITKKKEQWYQRQNYLDNVLYDLDAITTQIVEYEAERPSIFIVYGDHQPPIFGIGQGDSVPVHVIASDEKLLEEFYERGFNKGWFPPKTPEAEILHASWFSMLVRAVVRADGNEPPEFHRLGVSEMRGGM